MEENISKLYVGNLKFSATNEDLKNTFSDFGNVLNVNIIPNKGFGFVEMSSPEEAGKAKEALNGKELLGRTLKIDYARPPQQRRSNNFGSKKEYSKE